ncbi:MAG: type IV pilus assembly protein PilM [Planctomycetota bacterium]|nr:type IV pilus assembly protein PilM [Planctomycetota bacterium]
METHSVIWGLDIGHTSLKAVKLQRVPDGVTVLGYAIEPIPNTEDVDRDEAVVTALQTLAQREEMRGTPVVASLSGRQIFTRTINVPVLNPKKVDKMVELEARQQIPGDFDEIRWSYHLSPSVDGASNDVALFAARREIVDDLTAKLRKAGLELVGISVSSLAVYNFIAYDQEFEDAEAVVVLDVGAENTDLVVYQGDTLWMRTLGISGNDITRAFMKKFRVSKEEAEQLKCQVADSRQADRILKVVEPSLAELVSDVQRSLGFYKSQNRDAAFQNVVVSGNTFRLPGLAQFMADRLGFAIIELVELEQINVASGLDRDHFLEDLQSLGVAMGLGLQGLGLGKAHVNLLPTSQQLQTALKQKRWAAMVILAMIALTWVASFAVNQMRMNDNVDIKREIDNRMAVNEGEKGAAEKTANEIKPLSEIINPYASYGAHIGYLHGVERQVLGVLGQLAANKDLLPTDLKNDPLDGGEPVPQTVYLESLDIPKLDINAVATPFDQEAEQRRVVLQVKVPAYAKRFEVRSALKAQLEGLRLDETAWRARHPLADVPPADQRPKLFTVVESTREEPAQIAWTYVDPTHRDPVTNELTPLNRAMTQSAYLITFNCTLGEPAAPEPVPTMGMSGAPGVPGGPNYGGP